MRVVQFKKYHYILLFLVFVASFFALSSGESNKVYADCGANGVGPHGYAGAIIDVKIRKAGTNNLVEGRGGLYNINTLDPSDGNYPAATPQGNLYRIDSGNPGSRYDSANVEQINNSCVSGFGAESLVFGYGATSRPQAESSGSWALDCDLSRHPSDTQKFRITGLEKPTNAGPGSWEIGSVEVGPANGQTARAELIWRESTPPPEVTVSIDYLDCNRIEWTVGGNAPANYRIVYSPDNNGDRIPDTNVFLGPWSGGAKGSFDSNISGLNRVPIRAFAQERTGPGPNDFATIGNVYVPANASQLCNETQTQSVRPTYILDVTCDGVYVKNIVDGDNTSNPVRLYGYFQLRNDLGGGIESWDRVPGSDFDVTSKGDVLLRWPHNLVADPDNQGWGMWIGNYDVTGAGAQINPRWEFSAELEGACHQATCSIDINESPALNNQQPNGVIVGQPYSGNVTITNPATSVPTAVYRHPDSSGQGWLQVGGSATVNASLPDLLGNGQLVAESVDGSINTGQIDFLGPNESIPRGGSKTFTNAFQLTAPGTIGEGRIAYYPNYPNAVRVGNECASPVYYFDRFDITPTAEIPQLSPHEENANQVTFDSATVKNIPPGVNIPNVTATRKIFRDSIQICGDFTAPANFTAGDPSDSRQFSDPCPTDGSTRTSNRAYCGLISVYPAQGWVGPGSRVIPEGPAKQAGTADCIRPPGGDCPPLSVCEGYLPYVKVYGGDVAAGIGFVDASASCVPASAGIFAYMRPINEQNQAVNGSGSGGQLASYAWGSGANNIVQGFASASLRDNPPRAQDSNKLTFSNSLSEATTQITRPTLGGRITEGATCNADYYNAMIFQDGSDRLLPGTNNIVVNNLIDDKQTQISGSVVTLSTTGNYPAGRQHTVFVEGDAVIQNNIVYDTGSYSSNDLSLIPNFTLVVKGNIYIDNDVTQLDGRYIAQPDNSGNGGSIYTCAQAQAPFTSSFSACNRQLKIYGNFIAKNVELGRTNNSIKDSRFKENVVTGPSNAAEIFIFSPEVYLSPPVSRTEVSPTSGNYQSISTLPPVL